MVNLQKINIVFTISSQGPKKIVYKERPSCNSIEEQNLVFDFFKDYFSVYGIYISCAECGQLFGLNRGDKVAYRELHKLALSEKRP